MYHLPFYIVLNTSCLPFKILHQSCFHYLGITPGVYMCVGGGGGTHQSFIQGGSTPRYNPLPLLYTTCTFDRKGIPCITCIV